MLDPMGFDTDQGQLCIIIPVYNHEEAVGQVLAQLQCHRLPVLLINDGSGKTCSQVLRALARDSEQIHLLELPENRGKGGAVKAGLHWAAAKGFSHALQLDADGQHDVGDLETFLAAAKAQPAALISGLPVYDENIPKSRYYGRQITHFWVRVHTLSAQIKDSMCGYRVYPVQPVVELLNAEFTGDRMDFDIEVMVRWVWRGGEIVHLPTRVFYPDDGVSHFKLWGDNFLISKMHTRLFFGMLLRLPWLIAARVGRAAAYPS